MPSLLKSQLLIFFTIIISHALCQVETVRPDQVIELFRHGARAPISAYDPNWPLSVWGLLTPVGMRQQYILGKVLAEEYPGIFTKNYNLSEIYMLSDTTARCIQSAVTQLYGMYMGTGPALNSTYPYELAVPPFEDPDVQKVAESLSNAHAVPGNFVPSVVNIVDVTNAYIFQGNGPLYCPNTGKWLNENKVGPAAQRAMQMFRDTIINVNQFLPNDIQVKDVNGFLDFADTLECDMAANVTLLGITNPDLMSNLTFGLSVFTYIAWEGQLLQRQLNAFSWVNDVLSQLASFRQGTTFNRAALYSGHDSNILDVLAAFGVITEECLLENFESFTLNKTLVHPNCYYPGFASNLILEFYNTSSSYVKFYYNNAEIPLCNGQPACTYDQFVFFARNATGNNTMASFLKKCNTGTTIVNEIMHPEPLLSEVVILNATQQKIENYEMALAVLACLCVLILVKMIMDSRNHKKLLRGIRGDTAGSFTDLSVN